MKNYFHYVYAKLKQQWREDKGMFFFIAWFISLWVMLGGILIISFVGYTNNKLALEMAFSPLGIIFFVISGFALGGVIVLSIPMWNDIPYFTWQIISLPYTMVKGIYHTIQEDRYNYKAWKEGWKGEYCSGCLKVKNCEMAHWEISGCSEYRTKENGKLQAQPTKA